MSDAGIGLNYYSNRDASGLTGNSGADLGSCIHGSIACQLPLENRNYLELGVGAADVFGYGGAVYPTLAYEQRFQEECKTLPVKSTFASCSYFVTTKKRHTAKLQALGIRSGKVDFRKSVVIFSFGGGFKNDK